MRILSVSHTHFSCFKRQFRNQDAVPAPMPYLCWTAMERGNVRLGWVRSGGPAWVGSRFALTDKGATENSRTRSQFRQHARFLQRSLQLGAHRRACTRHRLPGSWTGSSQPYAAQAQWKSMSSGCPRFRSWPSKPPIGSRILSSTIGRIAVSVRLLWTYGTGSHTRRKAECYNSKLLTEQRNTAFGIRTIPSLK